MKFERPIYSEPIPSTVPSKRKASTETTITPATPPEPVQEAPTRNAANGENRPFPCPLRLYGCQNTFASKNEWKRHVIIQHMDLNNYCCPICPARPAFNRKDLFTQHLERMHQPGEERPSRSRGNKSPKRNSKTPKKNYWADTNVYEKALTKLREPPFSLECVFCDEPGFDGDEFVWERWLEHTGRHLAVWAKQDPTVDADAYNIRWERDTLFRDWLHREGFLTKRDGRLAVPDKR